MSKKITLTQFLSGTFFSLFVLTLCFLVIPTVSESFNGLVIFTYIINGIISLSMLVVSSGRYKFSLQTTHWIFFFFFFVFAPIIQYISSDFPTGLIPTDYELIKVNLILTIWAIVFYCATKIVKINASPKKEYTYRAVNIKHDRMVLLIFVSIFLTVYKIASIGFIELLSRDTSAGENATYSSIEQLFTHTVNAIVVLCFAFACIYNRKAKHGYILFVSAVCMFICCFPTGTARYNAAAVYFALLLLLFSKFIKGRRFTYLFILGLIVVFPMLDAFRNSSFVDADIFGYAEQIFKDYSSYFTEGHYDAYTMLIRTIRYVGKYGISFGYQLLGNIFFFVPRNIWPSKPVGTGSMIMTDLNADFTNVSAPLPAEGYINFGIIGLLLFAFLLGYFLKKYDTYCWETLNFTIGESFGTAHIFYCYFISLLFFMLRGDLMSSTAYTAAYFVVCYILSRVYFQSTKIDLSDRDVSL